MIDMSLHMPYWHTSKTGVDHDALMHEAERMAREIAKEADSALALFVTAFADECHARGESLRDYTFVVLPYIPNGERGFRFVRHEEIQPKVMPPED